MGAPRLISCRNLIIGSHVGNTSSHGPAPTGLAPDVRGPEGNSTAQWRRQYPSVGYSAAQRVHVLIPEYEYAMWVISWWHQCSECAVSSSVSSRLSVPTSLRTSSPNEPNLWYSFASSLLQP